MSSSPHPPAWLDFSEQKTCPQWRLEPRKPNPTYLHITGASEGRSDCEPVQKACPAEDKCRHQVYRLQSAQSGASSSDGNRTRISLSLFYYSLESGLQFLIGCFYISLSLSVSWFRLIFFSFLSVSFSLKSGLWFFGLVFFILMRFILTNKAHLVKGPNTPPWKKGGTLKMTDLWKRATKTQQQSVQSIHQAVCDPFLMQHYAQEQETHQAIYTKRQKPRQNRGILPKIQIKKSHPAVWSKQTEAMYLNKNLEQQL